MSNSPHGRYQPQIFWKFPQYNPLHILYWPCFIGCAYTASMPLCRFLETFIRAVHSVPSICIWNEMVVSVFKKKVTFIYRHTHSRQMTYCSLQFIFPQNVFYYMNCTLPFSVAAFTINYNTVKCSFLRSFHSYKPKVLGAMNSSSFPSYLSFF